MARTDLRTARPARPLRAPIAAWPLVVVAACLAVAALTLLVPSAPTTDPWGWIVWGREVMHLDLVTDIRGTPSWKPLPVMVTAPLSLFGSVAPVLWVVFARAAALLGLVFAFRVAGRLVGDRGVAVRSAAGVLAAIGLALTLGWIRPFSHAYTEPGAIMLPLAVQSTGTWPGSRVWRWCSARWCPAAARRHFRLSASTGF